MKKRAIAAVLVSACVASSWPQLAASGSSPARPHAPIGAAASDDAVLLWSVNAGEAATAACIAPLDNPLHESRMYAIMHIAIHDALNAIDRRSRPYVYDANHPDASPDAAVAAAARTVLVKLIGQLPAELPPPARASLPASPAPKPTTPRRSPRSRTVRRRRRASSWERQPRTRSSPREPMTERSVRS